MKKIFFWILLIFPGWVFTQVEDDFSDGDLTSGPSWQGDLEQFRISSSSAVPEELRPALQLYSEGSDTSFLVTENSFFNLMQWNCWLKISFNSSSNNNARIYLISDKAWLEGPLNGYYIQTGGTDDSVWFCRQDSLLSTPLLCFEHAYTGNSTNSLRIKVTRDSTGLWKFYSDPLGGNGLLAEGQIIENTYKNNEYFGLFCKYSSSNSSKFYFDDIYAGPLIIDSIPPELIKASVTDSSELRLVFSENLDPSSLSNIYNYYLNEGMGNPLRADPGENSSIVNLVFSGFFEEGKSYILTISGISDPAGNISDSIYTDIIYYQIRPYDIVINEIMADPLPEVGLGPFEYLELFNTSPFPIELEGWELITGSAEHSFPDISILPESYLVITSEEAAGAFSIFCKAIGFSSFGISNSGQEISLLDDKGNIISTVDFSTDWYGGSEKAEGGWSLELADPYHPCMDEGNWAASGDPHGGSPGSQNYNLREFDAGQGIEKICCLDEYSLEVRFKQKMDSLSLRDVSNYRFAGGPGDPVDLSIIGPDYRSVIIYFEDKILPGTNYSIEVNTNILNCIQQESGILMEGIFGLTSEAVPFDIVLNEILFNPLGDGKDFVEIYNRSDKIIDLGEIYIASVKETAPNPPDTSLVKIAEGCFPLFPGQYLAISSDPSKVREQYFSSDPEALLKVSSLPAFNNDKGCVLLLDVSRNIIDGMHYTEAMQYPLLHSFEGVSLEKLHYDRLGDDPLNWHSASEMCGFGTPGLENSQFTAGSAEGQALDAAPTVFSPNGDGINDVLSVTCKFQGRRKAGQHTHIRCIRQ